MENQMFKQPRSLRTLRKTLSHRSSSKINSLSSIASIPPLPSSMSTINLQITARHKAARITDAEHRSAPVLFRNTELSQHILRRPVAPTLRVFFEQSFDHGSRDVARGDGVDADTVGAPFRGEVAAELQDGGFGGVVSRADEALFNHVSVVSSKHTVRKWIEGM